MGTLSVKGLTAHYGKTTALHGIDLDLADGEFFVILGPSGAGKTTTLKSVAGLVDQVEGEVRIAGRDMTGVEPYDRGVAMAFESYALYPQKTVEENLASPLRSGRNGTWTPQEQAERIKQVTMTLGIDHLLKRFPRELSNGQRQRTALGRVLVRPAEVYLLDEPLSHLDAKLRAAMRAELKQLGELSGTTTLYVTHDYQEALALGDRIGVLREGRLVQVGTPAQVWTEPVDTFVARALGQPEMNLLDAEVDAGQARVGKAFAVGAPASDGPVKVGIRPRDLEIVDGPAPADRLVLNGKVVLAERLGRSVELSVDVAGVQVITVTSDHRVHEGGDVALAVDWDRVHVFSAEGARLGAARRPEGALTGGAR
ncbi:carbohydrate ABC transporter ATP-binding protein (CUT1 family) [Pseudonocardia hierapolitana]|uniref:Carbohydrate ABC transporter ATP-binding protein (CUT1 family) n=1 Tax=Pseudonocardia hierapolitana TaxID=1128676 RepID=A0A561SIJ7_9PSEU|nr:ABC transporter ATP-binding protein [Pseudonocardia hierapolitana]TWF74709.1 carbohydrate ABC transporter ATP-binding protein (CUT1 family) [Pseudonocardia hierapolitana]